MIDNFELIKSLFYFNEANNMFFHCQIVQRAKDHKDEERSIKEGAIKTYFIRSSEHLEKLKPEIILLCEHYGARAYINVAGKEFRDVNNELLFQLSLNNKLNNVVNPRKLLNSAAGKVLSHSKKWIIDIDDISMKDDIITWLCMYFENPDIRDFIITEVPTRYGIHLITVPFNTKEFNNRFPDVMIHKNSMGTLLYYPKCLK